MSLSLGRGQEEWDTVLLQVMRAYHSTPDTSTSETPNFLMLDQETQAPDHLTWHISNHDSLLHEYVGELVERMRTAWDMLWEKQWQVHSDDFD